MTDLSPPPQSFRKVVEAADRTLIGHVWEPLRGGRTNRVWRVSDRVVKLYDGQAQSPLFPNDPLAEQRALRLLGPLALAPGLHHAGADWVIYDHIEGTIWGGANPAPVARLLADVHRTKATGFRQLGSGTDALLAQTETILARCMGRLPVAALPPNVAPYRLPVLIHGDAVAGNIVVGRQGLCLIDWQCPAIGDPTEDLAAFLSPAMQWLYRGEILREDQVAAFLAAYPDQAVANRYCALRPAYQRRIAAHCLWKAERGATDYAHALTLELAETATGP